MRKRYYIEVKGLGDDGEKQLEEAGVAREAILVVDENEKHPSLIRALHEVTGMTKQEIFRGKSDRDHVSARVAYVHFALLDGDTTDAIAHDLSKLNRYIRTYIRLYDSRIYGDRGFKMLVSRLTGLLDADPMWRPLNVEKVVRTKQKGKRWRKARRVRPVNAKINKANTLQLTINFNEYE